MMDTANPIFISTYQTDKPLSYTYNRRVASRWRPASHATHQPWPNRRVRVGKLWREYWTADFDKPVPAWKTVVIAHETAFL